MKGMCETETDHGEGGAGEEGQGHLGARRPVEEGLARLSFIVRWFDCREGFVVAGWQLGTVQRQDIPSVTSLCCHHSGPQIKLVPA